MPENGTNGQTWWVTAIQTVGFPIVATIAISFGFYRTLEWEREKFIPALHDSTKAMSESSEASRAVKSSLDDFNKRRIGQSE